MTAEAEEKDDPSDDSCYLEVTEGGSALQILPSDHPLRALGIYGVLLVAGLVYVWRDDMQLHKLAEGKAPEGKAPARVRAIKPE